MKAPSNIDHCGIKVTRLIDDYRTVRISFLTFSLSNIEFAFSKSNSSMGTVAVVVVDVGPPLTKPPLLR